MDAKTAKTLRKYWIRISTARAALMQAWEKYGETNEEVLAAAVHFDRVMNKYNRFLQKIGGHAANTNWQPAAGEIACCCSVAGEPQCSKDYWLKN